MTKNFYRVVKKKITFDGLFHEKKMVNCEQSCVNLPTLNKYSIFKTRFLLNSK